MEVGLKNKQLSPADGIFASFQTWMTKLLLLAVKELDCCKKQHAASIADNIGLWGSKVEE